MPDYPLILDIMAFDNILAGLEAYTTNFNGFRELIKRSDAAKVLVQKYREKDPLAVEKDWSSFESFLYAKRISMMELFLCNKEILSQLDTDKKKDLMNEYRLKKSEKNKLPDLYKNKGFQTIYLAIVKLLESENIDLSKDINMDNVTSYITTGILISRDVFKEINIAVNNYLLTDLRSIGEESTYYEDNIRVSVQANVYTPKGHTVYGTIDDEMTETERVNMDIAYSSTYPLAMKINTYGGHSSTNLFNCHGYAWHVSEIGLSHTEDYRNIGGEDIYWKDYSNGRSYIRVDSLHYPRKTSPPPTYPGKIYYYSRNHSTVIANRDSFPSDSLYKLKLISKWANGPLMIHYPDYCPFSPPYDGNPNPLSIVVYHLNPKIFGETTTLCNSVQRTFTTDITNMPTGTLEWTHGNYLNAVGADNTYQYTVVGPGAGNTFVKIETTTPSLYGSTRVETWNGTKTFKINMTPEIGNQKVDGSTYYYAQQICPGGHWLSFVPYGGTGTTDTWTVPSGIQYSINQNQHRLDFYFLYNSSLTFTVTTADNCGSDSRSFYLIKKTSGCPYGMTLYPNPASDNVTVTMMENIPLTEYSDTTGITDVEMTYAKACEAITYTIRIYNSQSTLLSTFKISGKSFNIPLINMKDGTYIVEVNDGENNYRQQLVVKHN